MADIAPDGGALVVTWCCVVCVAWLAVSVPLALFFGRVCGLYKRCQYREEADDGGGSFTP